MKNYFKIILLLFSFLSIAQTTTTPVGSLKINNTPTLDNTSDDVLVRNPTTKMVNRFSKATFIGEILAAAPQLTLQNILNNGNTAISPFNINRSNTLFQDVSYNEIRNDLDGVYISARYSPTLLINTQYSDFFVKDNSIQLMKYKLNNASAVIDRKRLLFDLNGIGLTSTTGTNDFVCYLLTDNLTSNINLQAPSAGGTVATEEWVNATFSSGGGQDLQATLANGSTSTIGIDVIDNGFFGGSSTGNNYTYLDKNGLEIRNTNSFSSFLKSDNLTADRTHQQPDEDGTYATREWTNLQGFSMFDGSYSSLTGTPLTFNPSAHNHVIGDVTNLQTTIDNKVADFINDNATTIAPSQNAVFDALALKANASDVILTSGAQTKSGVLTLNNTPKLESGILQFKDISQGTFASIDAYNEQFSFRNYIDELIFEAGQSAFAFHKTNTISLNFDLSSLTSNVLVGWQNSNGTVAWTNQIPTAVSQLTNDSGFLTSYTETDPVVKAINGIVKSNGTIISTAVSGTDYAPATSGTSILKANGAGGFSNVTSTDINNTFGSQPNALFYATPNASAGTPSLRSLVVSDIPTLNQNTTGSAATLTTGRTFSVSGDATGTSATFNGSANASIPVTLATVNSNVGTFGNSTTVPVVTVNAKGLVTAVSTASITTGATNLDELSDVVITTPSNGQVLKYNGTNWVNDTSAGGGDALTANPLSQFASTTSSQLAGVISDEVGTGSLVLSSVTDAKQNTLDEDNVVQYCEFITAATTANPPFVGAAISSGTNAANTTNLNASRPGVVRMTSSTTANGGYKWQTDVASIRLGGNEVFTTGIAPVNFTTTTMYAGFHDSTTSALPVDGVYFKYATSGVIVLETSNNSTRSTSATITTLSLNNWYKLKITMNSNATSALGEVFNAAGTLIGSATLTTNIPTTAGREVGSGITVTESTTTATAMLDLDYIRTQFTVVR